MEHYEKGEKLGQGQFGVVIKARHKEVWHYTLPISYFECKVYIFRRER